jgi:hypothetical protein
MVYPESEKVIMFRVPTLETAPKPSLRQQAWSEDTTQVSVGKAQKKRNRVTRKAMGRRKQLHKADKA